MRIVFPIALHSNRASDFVCLFNSTSKNKTQEIIAAETLSYVLEVVYKFDFPRVGLLR